jgi:hypothetical protein
MLRLLKNAEGIFEQTRGKFLCRRHETQKGFWIILMVGVF